MGILGPQGPMVIEWLDIVRLVSVVIRPGSILPIHTSAFGLICAAYLPADAIARMLKSELPNPGLRSRKLSADKQAALFEEIRSDPIGGLDAIAVPVRDHRGDLVACLAAVGSSGGLDISASGRVVRELPPNGLHD